MLVPVLLAALALASSACGDDGSGTGGSGGSGGSGGAGGSGGGGVDPLGPWTAEPLTLDALPDVWGGIVAQASPTVAYLAGGVAGSAGPTLGKLFRVEQASGGVSVTEVSDQLAERYCGCALVDEGRGELVVIGGRNGSFAETPTAEIVDLTTGAVTALDAGEAAAHPVGCHAVFLPDRDEGFVFGGLAQSGGFTAQLFRYSPADHSFTLVDSTGPLARYDGAFRYPVPGGPVYLVGGMGLDGLSPEFFSDVWRLDPESGAWTEVSATGAVPQGRRLPWVAFSEDAASLVMGFGSDSPQGQTLLADLWRFDLSAGAWSEIAFEGVAPEARGFAQWLPGSAGSAGLLSGGLDDGGVAEAKLVLRAPVEASWR